MTKNPIRLLRYLRIVLVPFVLILAFGRACATDDENDESYYNERTIRASDIPSDAPTFDQYPVRAIYRGPVAAPDVMRDPESRLFRTMIRRGAKRGPNFAGHYTLVFWGCGAGCVAVAIVDAQSGKVFHPDNLSTIDNINVAYEELEPPDGELVKFRRDSKLLVVMGGINEDSARRGISYFIWDREQLRRIRFVHKPYE